MSPCDDHELRRIVLTGGPGAGKTAVLEMVRGGLVCHHVRVLPEAASIVFGGGFPRGSTMPLRKSAQRAIFYVQRELESSTDATTAIELCDRGTVDTGAYWPGPEELWPEVGTTLDEQLARYHAVIHLRTPTVGYDHSNPLRIESVAEAQAIDARIAALWARHPRRYEVPAELDFLTKARHAIHILRSELPRCCAEHAAQSAPA